MRSSLLVGLGFNMHPFVGSHGRRRGRDSNVSKSRHGAQEISLFDNFFSPMRMPKFDLDPFAGDFGGGGLGNVSTFNFSFGFVYIDDLKCLTTISF